MNKIIITGHPYSGYGAVESLLLACGMREALPSRRDCLLPKEIHNTLCNAHQIPDLLTITEERDFIPPHIGSVWHGMALDLLLGNLGHEPWGWADPNTLFFLEYWRNLDPNSVFVLVYDEPASALLENPTEVSSEKDERSVVRRLDNWFACNSAMLRFYFQNRDRCVLVHSRELAGNANYCLEEIQNRLSAPLEMSSAPDEIIQTDHYPLTYRDDEWAATAAEIGFPTSIMSSGNPTERYLIDCLLEHRLQYRDLYDELQAAANRPWNHHAKIPNSATEAWIAWNRERDATVQAIREWGHYLQRNDAKILSLRKDHQLTSLQHSQACEELQQARLDAQSLGNENALKSGELDRLRKDQKLTSLLYSQACEEVQQALLDAQSLRIQNSHISEKLERLSNDHKLSSLQHSQACEQVQQALIDAQSLRIENTSKSEELDRLRDDHQLISQRHSQACEELQQATLDAQSLRNENSSKSEELEKAYAERDSALLELEKIRNEIHNAAKLRTGAAERVKKHLSYRLGSLMISDAKSPIGFICLPFSVFLESQRFKRDKRKKMGNEPSPLREYYSDAYEAEKVQKQLPYRLGNTLIRRCKSPLGWLFQPYALIRQTKTQAFRRSLKHHS